MVARLVEAQTRDLSLRSALVPRFGAASLSLLFALAFAACERARAPREGQLASGRTAPVTGQIAPMFGQGPADSTPTYVFACEKDYRFTVQVIRDSAWVFLPEKIIALPHVATASGAKYSDGTFTFWNRDGGALLETDVGEFRACRGDSALGAWDAAKLRGVSFRGIGRGPGWLLEIDGEWIRFVYDSGERILARTPDPVPGPGMGATYQGRTDEGRELTVILEGRPCTEVMSGEAFETAVTVRLDDKELRGCGRTLRNVPPDDR